VLDFHVRCQLVLQLLVEFCVRLAPLHDTALPLCSTTVISTPPCTISSSTQHLLTVPRCRTVVGARRFSVAAPEVWNSLAKEIRNYETLPTLKKNLYTYLSARTGPILSVFPALIVHSELKSVHPGFPVAFIF